MTSAPLYGLVLAGGASKRMHRDKAALAYGGKPQLLRAFELLQPLCSHCFVSVQPEQTNEPLRAGLPQIVDKISGIGPIAGIHAAQSLHPEAAWLVLACDLPLLTTAMLANLLKHRDPARAASAYRSSHDGLPEPLCAVYEPHSAAAIARYIEAGGRCPRKFMMNTEVHLLEALDAQALDNVNTADEYQQAQQILTGATSQAPAEGTNGATQKTLQRQLQVQYFAVLREQAGRSQEQLTTAAATPAALYEELQGRYAFKLTREQLKVAINAEFKDWNTPLQTGDAVVFIPPVSGG